MIVVKNKEGIFMMEERKFIELDVDDVLPNRFQPRIKFNETSLNELATSIKEHGVIEPIVVRKLGDKYEIIAGERRYKATILAGLEKIPAIVTDMNDKKSSEVALIENVQRQDLTPIEEAISYKKILDMGYLTQNDLATKLGKNQSTVANKLRLLDLADEVQEALLDTQISERHARSLLKIKNKEQQKEVLDKIIEDRLTVRKTDEYINSFLQKQTAPVEEKTQAVEEEIETVDLEEEKTMDMNSLNGTTIPEVTPVVPEIVEDAKEAPQVEEVNPGFVNVEAIEKNAETIYQEKPLAPLDSLLEKSPQGPVVPVVPVAPVAPVVPESEDSSSDSDDEFMLKPGKFFNLFPEEEETKPQPAPQLDNIFNNMTPIEPVSDVPDINRLFGTYDPVVPSALEKQEEIPNLVDMTQTVSTPAVETIETPVIEIPTPEVAQVVSPAAPQLEEVIPAVEEIPVVENIPATPIIEEVQAPAATPVVDEIDYSKFYDILEDEPKVEEPKKEEPVVEEVTVPYNNFALRNGPELEIKVPGTTPTPSKAVVDMKTVINTIRSCADTIEKYGFEIDVDELDLEDNYTVTFKISKK